MANVRIICFWSVWFNVGIVDDDDDDDDASYNFVDMSEKISLTKRNHDISQIVEVFELYMMMEHNKTSVAIFDMLWNIDYIFSIIGSVLKEDLLY